LNYYSGQNVRFRSKAANFSATITNINNLPAGLLFNSGYNSNYLNVEPNRCFIPSFQILDINVRVKKQKENQLPRLGEIKVIYNNEMCKLVKVSLYPSKQSKQTISLNLNLKRVPSLPTNFKF